MRNTIIQKFKLNINLNVLKILFCRENNELSKCGMFQVSAINIYQIIIK